MVRLLPEEPEHETGSDYSSDRPPEQEVQVELAPVALVHQRIVHRRRPNTRRILTRLEQPFWYRPLAQLVRMSVVNFGPTELHEESPIIKLSHLLVARQILERNCRAKHANNVFLHFK